LRVSSPIDFLNEHPFLSGLALGMLLAAAVWVRSLVLALYGRREIGRLKELLQTKLEVEAHAHRKLSTELEDLRKQNENLRVTVSSLQQKPDRAELRQLYVYDIAIRSLHTRLSGFGPAWQAELDVAERQMSERETGIGAFVRRALSPRPTRVLGEPTIVDEPKSRS
jgi:Tfp pilus assembly protein PilO